MTSTEKITGRFLVPSILRSTEDACGFWSGFRDLNPTVDHLYSRLVKERISLKSWVTQMNAAGYKGTSFLLGVKWRDVHVLLVLLQQYAAEAEERYASISETVVDPQTEVGKYLARIKFIKAGYNDLDDIVGTIGKINKALSAISPPPPPYVQKSSSRASSKDRGRLSALATRARESQRRQDEPNAKLAYVDNTNQKIGASNGSKFPIRQNETVRADGSDMSTLIYEAVYVPEGSHMDSAVDAVALDTQILEPSIDKSTLDETPLNLREVYSLCLRSLECLAMSDSNCEVPAQLMGSRLKLWGVGLFNGSASLDVLLRDDRLNCDRTRESLNKYMIMLLSHIDVVLKIIVEDQNRTTAAIFSMLVEVQNLLSSNAAQTYILKQWQINFDENLTVFSSTYDAHSDSAQAFERRPSSGAGSMTSMRDELPSSESRKVQHLQSAGRLIETLFQLLPVLEIMRSRFWCNMSRAAVKAVDGTVTSQYLSPVLRTQIVKSSPTNLDIVQRYIVHRDEVVQKEDKKSILFSPIFEKQQERLKQYEWSGEADRRAEVKRQVEGLLASMVQDIKSKDLQANSTTLQLQLMTFGEPADVLNKDAKSFAKKEQDMMLRDFVESLDQILM